MLRLFGAKVGRLVRIMPTVKIVVPWTLIIGDETVIGDNVTLYSLGKMRIGSQVTISQGSHLCGGTHDYTRADFPLIKSPISIGDGAWICADAFIGPGVSVGEYAIIAARSVVTKDVAAWKIVRGNPAAVIGARPPINPQ